MIQVGTRVKVLDNYFGGLTDVVGKIGKVVRVIHTAPEVETQYVLDFRGTRTKKYKFNGYEESYTYNYDVIVNHSEIEEVPYDFRDKEGNLVELGDTIVYGVHGGGIIKGTVVDFKDKVYPRWGTPEDVLKIKVEFVESYPISDGGHRSTQVENKRTVWLSNQNQTLIIWKRSSLQIDKNLIMLCNDK